MNDPIIDARGYSLTGGTMGILIGTLFGLAGALFFLALALAVINILTYRGKHHGS